MAFSTPKIIAIVGATGAQGGSVLNTFLTHSDYHIRALTRDPTSTKAQSLASRSPRIEVVSADVSDVGSLLRAFQNATAIFAVTDWMAIYQHLSFRSQAPLPGQSLNQRACSIETQQALNIFDAASAIPTLERLIFSTLTHVSKWSKGKYTHSYHFDSKAVAVENLPSTHLELWTKTSLIQMGVYLENFLNLPLFKPHKDADTGEIVFDVLGSSEQPKMVWPFVAAGEDTGPLVLALIDQLAAQKHVLVHRAMMSFAELWGFSRN